MGRFYPVVNKDGKVISYYGEHVSRQVTATGAWVAGATLGDLQLDRDMIITNMRLRVLVVHAGLTATALIDGPKRLLQTLAVIGDGKNFLSLTGGAIANQLGTLLALLNQFDAQSASLASVTDVGATAVDQSYFFHPGHNVRDRFDLSVCIPARALSNLVARIGCPAATALDAAATITSAVYSIEIDGVQGVPITSSMFYPNFLVQNYAHTAISGALGQKFDVPTGGYLRRIILLTQDATAVNALRADTQVTAVQLEIPKDSKNQLTHSFVGLKFANAMRYGVVGDQQPSVLGAIATTRPGYNGSMVMPLGFAIIDLRETYDPVLGLNMTRAQQGDAKLALTTAVATGNTFIGWDMVYPMSPEWLGK